MKSWDPLLRISQHFTQRMECKLPILAHEAVPLGLVLALLSNAALLCFAFAYVTLESVSEAPGCFELNRFALGSCSAWDAPVLHRKPDCFPWVGLRLNLTSSKRPFLTPSFTQLFSHPALCHPVLYSL